MKICRSGKHTYEFIIGSKKGCPECYKLRELNKKVKYADRIKKNRRDYYIKNKEKENLKTRTYYNKNKEKIKKLKQKSWPEYYENNKEKVIDRARKFRIDNLEHCRNVKKVYKKENAGKVNALCMKRHASKLKATPKWLTVEQLKEIEQFYIDAKELQWLSDPTDPLQVDHIEPLQGKDRCGLHVPWNLQILPRSLNVKKGNKTK